MNLKDSKQSVGRIYLEKKKMREDGKNIYSNTTMGQR